ncbi:uncharacterized protein CC84DRAFT_1177091 [Paraphaeosphaeria sporulosa]|uniref:Uncharacterized protein n=1 Tax=Paraphaeosphaeria sporulosa TaxID=1460663 RepID=A0A177CDJ3_9PLEO|nr:uncharacterized protein CC84DRAFT_1177091 [Paraphaeosphaeria sporulosa]OAG04962.1 hypothetical protein CC84DRAFT_1177091 [Paraphaeosphaeria sporulosa]
MRLLLTQGRGTATRTREEAFCFSMYQGWATGQPASVGTGASEPSTDVVWPDASRAPQRDKALRTYKDSNLPTRRPGGGGAGGADWAGRALHEHVGVAEGQQMQSRSGSRTSAMLALSASGSVGGLALAEYAAGGHMMERPTHAWAGEASDDKQSWSIDGRRTRTGLASPVDCGDPGGPACGTTTSSARPGYLSSGPVSHAAGTRSSGSGVFLACHSIVCGTCRTQRGRCNKRGASSALAFERPGRSSGRALRQHISRSPRGGSCSYFRALCRRPGCEGIECEGTGRVRPCGGDRGGSHVWSSTSTRRPLAVVDSWRCPEPGATAPRLLVCSSALVASLATVGVCCAAGACQGQGLADAAMSAVCREQPATNGDHQQCASCAPGTDAPSPRRWAWQPSHESRERRAVGTSGCPSQDDVCMRLSFRVRPGRRSTAVQRRAPGASERRAISRARESGTGSYSCCGRRRLRPATRRRASASLQPAEASGLEARLALLQMMRACGEQQRPSLRPRIGSPLADSRARQTDCARPRSTSRSRAPGLPRTNPEHLAVVLLCVVTAPGRRLDLSPRAGPLHARRGSSLQTRLLSRLSGACATMVRCDRSASARGAGARSSQARCRPLGLLSGCPGPTQRVLPIRLPAPVAPRLHDLILTRIALVFWTAPKPPHPPLVLFAIRSS